MQYMRKTRMIHPHTRVYSMQTELPEILYRTRQLVLFSATISKVSVTCHKPNTVIHVPRNSNNFMNDYLHTTNERQS